MNAMGLSPVFRALTLGLCIACAVAFCASPASLKLGKAELKSAGPLAFGPDGILFVGDSAAAAIVALDTEDRAPGKSAGAIEVRGINEKIAAVLGTAPDQILINDMVVNPLSKKVYLSVSRGKGPDATPVILRMDATGKLTELSLDNVKHSSVELPNAPDAAAKDSRGQSHRMETITDLQFVNGSVVVAGLSNEEFSSTLRSIPFPFQQASKGANIEIYHGSHGRFETNAPVRTFVPYKIKGESYILAAYTCTPLVKIPVSELKPGNKVKGTTIAELGNRNRPISMVAYHKDGHEYILMANSSRGVMKLRADALENYEAITAHTEIKGVPYETIASLKGVQQLDKYNDSMAVILAGTEGTLDLRTIPLP